MPRELYLEGTPLAEALEKWLGKIESEGCGLPFSGEPVQVKDSLGRVTAEAVIARISSPFYHSSAMDGYAVRFADTFGTSETSPKRLLIGEQAVYVDTGDPLPDGFNAVIMIEDVNIIRAKRIEQRAERYERETQNEYIEIIVPATPWQNVVEKGEVGPSNFYYLWVYFHGVNANLRKKIVDLIRYDTSSHADNESTLGGSLQQEGKKRIIVVVEAGEDASLISNRLEPCGIVVDKITGGTYVKHLYILVG